MLAQMAATAGSVAVGSTIGHGLSSMLFGGSSSAAPAEPVAQAAPAPPQTYQTQGISCEVQARGELPNHRDKPFSDLLPSADFTKCLEKADLPSCTWYLEQLKAVSDFGRFTIFSLTSSSVPGCSCSLLIPPAH